ncbi:MAG: helix-turn-helix domain-containing protein [Pigmentiphaga sp.]|uniref:helix-turn-helix domain-containing protein n=1 Tax=Pigmentiphaga sp. TaxID=1977564 RepID=UPI0029B9A553|nr:helix-turn-helix domain-containing protein [Pigmentiphaga sp.]MDX3907126.1 helix-turn-helix domain-containing protein [Pigmentiphaga sp.]
MDGLISAAARALAAGAPLAALNYVSLRDDASALALRGIAMAQLGDFSRATALVRRAARAFGPKDAVARAKCVVAEAEIALASRELNWPAQALEAARATMEACCDWPNAVHARQLEVRRLLLIGRLDEAERMLATMDPRMLPSALQAVHELIAAGIAMRRLQAEAARAALDRGGRWAKAAGIPALVQEVEQARRALALPAARLRARGQERPLLLDEVEALLVSRSLVVDACRHGVRQAGAQIPLATRPVLFTLARLLAEAWPDDVARTALIAQAFRTRRPDESHRARLRVEIGRLRKALAPLAAIAATRQGFRLEPLGASEVVVLARPVDTPHASLLALLADGESWSSSALALALGASQRTVQRGLDALAAAGKVESVGRGRARRWMTSPVPGFATSLLLPVPFAVG